MWPQKVYSAAIPYFPKCNVDFLASMQKTRALLSKRIEALPYPYPMKRCGVLIACGAKQAIFMPAAALDLQLIINAPCWVCA